MALSFSKQNGAYASVSCTNWMDFRDKAHRYLRENANSSKIYKKFLFRGQSCSLWDIQSSFQRKFGYLSAKDQDEKYLTMLNAFERNYRVYGSLSKDNSIITNLETKLSHGEDNSTIEAIAQHYGIPTRFIDFTYSIFVATFFAFSKPNECESGEVSVFALSSDIDKVFSDKHLSTYQDEFSGNERNLWQLGIFVKNNSDHSDLRHLFSKEAELINFEKHSKPLLIQFDIPLEAREEALDDLNMMRINSMSIFPGLEGIVNWINKGGTFDLIP